jgi:hypothetical protein
MGKIQNGDTEKLTAEAGGSVFMLKAAGRSRTSRFEFRILDLFRISIFGFRAYSRT